MIVYNQSYFKFVDNVDFHLYRHQDVVIKIYVPLPYIALFAMLCRATKLRLRLPKIYLGDQLATSSIRRHLGRENLHRNGGQSANNGDACNGEEAVTNTLHGNPVVDVECHAEGEHVLDELR